MGKRITAISALLAIFALSLVFATGGIKAWLIKSEKKEIGATASVHKSYYESGDGLSPETAFEIARPMQYYYFTWLQNLGFYNAAAGDETAVNAGRMPSPVYFKVSRDLNMSGFTLPSVGTSEYPFVGVFDGGGYTLSGLTVSNTTDGGELVYPPNGYENVVGFQITGVFGIIGKPEGASVDYDASAACLKNLVLSDVTVKTETPRDDSSLIGVVAGYVNGYVENVSVMGGSVYIADGIVPLSEYTSYYSDYTLVGYCENDYKSLVNLNFTEYFEPIKDSGYIAGSVSQGPGDNWGGSIDMKALNLRLYDLLNSGTVSYSANKYMGYYRNGDQSVSVGRNGNVQTYYRTHPTAQRLFYYLLGDGMHTYRNQNYYLPGTYIPLLVDENYNTLDCNTGYIVSDTASLSGVSGTIRSSSYEVRFISNSLDDVNKTRAQVNSGTGTTFPAYDKTKTEILTNGGATYSANDFVLIKDETEGFNGNHVPASSSAVYGRRKGDDTTPSALGLGKYNAARLSLDTVLSGEDYIHGIHFVGSSISMNKLITVDNVIINGNVYGNYQMPKSSVNFRVKEEGHINCFAGSYYSRTGGSWADSFFSLHEVERNGSTITAIKEIVYVYENTDYNPDMSESKKYVYQYAGESKPTTAGALVFDMRFLTEQPPVDNALYYFEIPVNAGEYALGTVAGKSGGGYLMYLDISATAAEMTGEKTVETRASVKYLYEYPTGISVSGAANVPPAVLAEYISTVGVKSVDLNYFGTNELTPLLIRNAAIKGITGDAVAVKPIGMEETVSERAVITETVNGETAVFIIITTTVYLKDAEGNILSENTVCTATKDGTPTAVPAGYGGAAVRPTDDAVIRYRYTDYGGTVSDEYYYTAGENGGAGTFFVSIASDADTILTVEIKADGYVLAVNGEIKEQNDTAEIISG